MPRFVLMAVVLLGLVVALKSQGEECGAAEPKERVTSTEAIVMQEMLFLELLRVAAQRDAANAPVTDWAHLKRRGRESFRLHRQAVMNWLMSNGVSIPAELRMDLAHPLSGLARRVTELAEDETPVDGRQATAQNLANSYRAIEDQIAVGVFANAEQIFEDTRSSNRAALGDQIEAWRPFMDGLARELEALFPTDQLELTDRAAVRQAWGEIALGLEAVGSEFKTNHYPRHETGTLLGDMR